jgi:hypothetical protein
MRFYTIFVRDRFHAARVRRRLGGAATVGLGVMQLQYSAHRFELARWHQGRIPAWRSHVDSAETLRVVSRYVMVAPQPEPHSGSGS